jgi:polyhydroxybutyrate depolymerase
MDGEMWGLIQFRLRRALLPILSRLAGRASTVMFPAFASGILFALLSFSGRAAGPSATATATLESGGLTRSYLLHLPPAYDGKSKLPLVLVLHGGTQSPESAEHMSGMSAKADRENFIAAYPKGTGRTSMFPTWNSGNCCAYAMDQHVDDAGFLRALIEKLEHDYSVDPRRVYVTGISNGGMMSYRAACELADKIAAIAPVEGALNVECHPSAPVSVIIFHGTADRLVPYNGGSTPFQLGARRSDNSVAGAVDFWVRQNGCSPSPKHEDTSAVHTDIFSGCKNGTAVALYAVQGGRHMWPGTPASANRVPATDLMWAFFKAHPKQ